MSLPEFGSLPFIQASWGQTEFQASNFYSGSKVVNPDLIIGPLII